MRTKGGGRGYNEWRGSVSEDGNQNGINQQNQIPFLSMPKFSFPGGGTFSRRFLSRLFGLFLPNSFLYSVFFHIMLYIWVGLEWIWALDNWYEIVLAPHHPTNKSPWCWQVVSRFWYLHNYKLLLLTIQLLPQLSNLWLVLNSVRIGFGPAMKTGISRQFKQYPTTHMWVSSWLPFTVD